MRVLAIESSCDETAAAVLEVGKERDFRLKASLVASQVELHRPFGGIVPEIASRKHLEVIYPLVRETLGRAGISPGEVDLVAVTTGPGLVGALVVGVSFAKSLAFSLGKPLVPVDHVRAHSLAIFLENAPEFPWISLVVSGGHTALFLVRSPTEHYLLGHTRDDAAGEAFDKVAKLLHLGYPGGPVISRLAEKGDPDRICLPRPMLDSPDFDFSFAGLKTAVLNVVRSGEEFLVHDLCAAFEAAVAEVLVEKTVRAVKAAGIGRVVVSGGVAANRRLRGLFEERACEEGFEVFFPSPQYCTDNAAMVAVSGYFEFTAGHKAGWDLDVYARARFPRYSF
ncbi:tRNA (adenosine(37)-N6)-threonylcarbamoyltransferase complex transferase subunit TsaD [Thermosulfurimonas sp. F29]|uniref:tRNA (adenosine(37)-N6)-threonylcarbamoyltransferase complex transferase subunit TsaD n=1 Tax=Thermosulfurimonas sp. F29 TaxID=2867247 RepID=UPI001C83B26B|nr:tRNA (adenosine(37)-N6)-threonylcarbamoyltransferase complex transferase subunit TsaD [Thermosulfurimonas sp. F29]MBX6423664.1 tRNA (adenosine(37)-N6)-threonylcarbamoyltransferase complex transferase subunit TsaD [Thermosulfurimonas sp. F29]